MCSLSICDSLDLIKAVPDNFLLPAQVVPDIAQQQQGSVLAAVLQMGMSLAWIPTWTLSWPWPCACPCKRSARARRPPLLLPMPLRPQLRRVSVPARLHQSMPLAVVHFVSISSNA